MKAASFVLALWGLGCTGRIEAGPQALDSQATAGVVGEGLRKDLPPPPVPAAISVPAGHKLHFVLDAVGQQVYVCRANAVTGVYGWVLKEPDADLLKPINGQIAGTHYVGPTWEALDGSTVVAARVAGVTPDASAIPWLLLQAVSHGGEGRMEDVSYIQRLETTAGLAPSSGCDAGHAEQLAPIDYTATYYFFVPHAG